jgi:hypothetical protein
MYPPHARPEILGFAARGEHLLIAQGLTATLADRPSRFRSTPRADANLARSCGPQHVVMGQEVTLARVHHAKSSFPLDPNRGTFGQAYKGQSTLLGKSFCK